MLRRSLLIIVVVCLAGGTIWGAEGDKVFRIGMIGLDTSHVVAFTKLLNDPAKGYGCQVVAGYPGGLGGFALTGRGDSGMVWDRRGSAT